MTPFYASASPVEGGTKRIATQLRDLNSIHGKQMRTWNLNFKISNITPPPPARIMAVVTKLLNRFLAIFIASWSIKTHQCCWEIICDQNKTMSVNSLAKFTEMLKTFNLKSTKLSSYHPKGCHHNARQRSWKSPFTLVKT